MTKLRKCPFCGREAKVCDDIEYTVGGYWIECKDCHIQTPSKIKSKEAVIKYWNTRKPIEAELETNADWIRSMNDEELLEYLYNVSVLKHSYEIVTDRYLFDLTIAESKQAILKWLKSPAKNPEIKNVLQRSEPEWNKRLSY